MVDRFRMVPLRTLVDLDESGRIELANKQYEKALHLFCTAMNVGFNYYEKKEPERDIDRTVFIDILTCIRELELYWIKPENQLNPLGVQLALNTFLKLKKKLALEDFEIEINFIVLHLSISNLLYQKGLYLLKNSVSHTEAKKLFEEAKAILETESLITLIQQSQEAKLLQQIHRENLKIITDDLESNLIQIKSHIDAIKAAPQHIQDIVQDIVMETMNPVEDPQKRITMLNEVIPLYPEYSLLYYFRGLTYRDIEDDQNAQTDFGKAIELDSTNVEAYRAHAILSGMLGKFDEVIIDMDKAIPLKSEDGHLYYIRGMAYRELGKLQEYIQDLQYAAQLGNQEAQEILSSQGIS